MSASDAAEVARELARALADLALLPVRAADELVCREALRGELLADLARPAPEVQALPYGPLGGRQLSIFVSCAEASGELHAAGLVEALRRECARAGAPAPRFLGLGGPALAERGVRLIGDPVRCAAMGFDGMLRALPFYLALLCDAAGALRAERPDVLVAVDSPALHGPLGRIARRRGVPVAHLVTPQLWGWAPWRAAGYRRAVDRALSILPFEPPWFARRGIQVVHVGHPLLDLLPPRPSAPPAATRVLALLCGSRRAVVERNLPWMLGLAARFRELHPEVEVAIPQGRAGQAELALAIVRSLGAESWARVEAAELHASLARARAAFSVSGTVLIDVLHHRLPTVVVYRLAGRAEAWMQRHLLIAPYIASPNLLAGREVMAEFCFHGAGPSAAVLGALDRCWSDEGFRERCRAGLEVAAARLGPPGALERAARAVLSLVAPAGPVPLSRGSFPPP